MNSLLTAVSVPEDRGRPILDAATREVVGYAPVHTVDELAAAISAAAAAQPGWADLGHAERSRLLHVIADDIDACAEELGEIITHEQGKAGGAGETHAAAHWLRAAADTVLQPQVLQDDGASRAELHYVPLGVVASIGPWNFPVMIAVWHLAPALRMGNTVVLKPSENTPLSVLALAEIFRRHLPADVLTAISGDREVGAALAAHPRIAKIVFTGSTATGRRIVAGSAGNLARLTLELGGNDAAIVLPDTDVDAVADKLFWAAFMNTGQVCAALKRLYVHESIYADVVSALAERAEKAPMGPGSDKANRLGPVQNPAQFEIVTRLVADARERGARIVTGGEPATELGPLFYRPTIVADVEDDAAVVGEEQFGPVLPVIRYAEVDDAIRRANSTDQGLGASVWGPDPDKAEAVARRMEAGTVWVNQHGGVDPAIPFGGTKSSGYGLEFGVEGLKAMAATKVIRR
ncbi:aldehyde dehydrogenase family protein [Kibdelosporangium phytohabitans]|uniref:Aldehyde dehydrogenase n=1 Tax=Kibdelosporangium phytohabitans TaxID=860235 RepID=A0A0N9I363_9PSEU|nr:aldehyde dehydrogenase family protein [Kibdelosporangium phytohabitans]ALG12216.1 aldehyde dehydrogenase [Kibdelosporangium phytohabitans]MBE1463751.1 acyl-CoA reductase-like NAD-dependent aldehyde dehydrogenase [Kibdelosporangium phytohabitans]